MRFSPLFAATLMGTLLSWCALAFENPLLSQGASKPDGRLGAFSQNNTGDCFFLASLLALAQDPDGLALIESAFKQQAQGNQWQITFPNLPGQPVTVTAQETREYQLIDSPGHGLSAPAWGDPDVKILEIAADKIWLKNIKAEGLWDDVPMNAVFMFSNAEQHLIWNSSKAANAHIQDIDKYRRIPKGLVKEQKVFSSAEAAILLKNIISTDHDGISMILIDFDNYHAVAISHIDFNNNRYGFIDTSANTRHEAGLDKLLHGIANGLYAINYLEIKPSL